MTSQAESRRQVLDRWEGEIAGRRGLGLQMAQAVAPVVTTLSVIFSAVALTLAYFSFLDGPRAEEMGWVYLAASISLAVFVLFLIWLLGRKGVPA